LNYDFNKVTDRQNTYSIKYDPAARGKPADVHPMWVADMDFPAPPCVTEALAQYARFGIFGYSEPDAAYFNAVQSWFARRFHWQVQREWLTITPGVVTAIFIAIRALTRKGDGVLIQQPVYYPFEGAVHHTKRTLLVNPLRYENGRYSINFKDFEEKIKQAKLFILCSPHNPVGRVWTQDELVQMGEICLKYNVPVFADEIWQDLIYAPHRHRTFAMQKPAFGDITLTATAPSKTFNLAGLQLSNVFIANEKMCEKYRQTYLASGLGQPALMGLVSCKAAYEHGAPWLEELLNYLAGNMALTHEYLRVNIPKIKPVQAEATYLAWLDCTALNMTPQALDDAITNKAKLWLSDGRIFGEGGAGFARINVACPRSVLQESLCKLERITQ